LRRSGAGRHKISHDLAAFEALFVDCLIEAHQTADEDLSSSVSSDSEKIQWAAASFQSLLRLL